MAPSTPTQPGATGRVFCAALSSERGEPLAATASHIDHWILVEYRGPWERDAVDDSLLSAELKAHVREQLSALRHARLLFVRKPERRAQSGRRVFFATSRPGEERLFALEFEHREDLLAVDFASALAHGPSGGAPVASSLFLVCTHGKRDACCARHGRPLYDALRDATDPDLVWQSTHVGGDRFAGNVVVLPHGLYYGRVAPEHVAGFLATHAAGKVDLDRYRGRSRYSFAVQAAEHAIRESAGALGIDDLAFLGSTPLEDGGRRVRFQVAGGATHVVDVVATLTDEPAYLTCGSAEPKRARRCLVTAHCELR